MKNSILILTLLFAFSAFGNTSFSPITKEQFSNSIDSIESLFSTEINSIVDKGIIFVKKWDNDTINAYTIDSKSRLIFLFGGLARAKGMTSDAFALVTCHELGHSIGGEPQRPAMYGIPKWSSVEGQSDYFSAKICSRKLFEDEYIEIDRSKLTIGKAAIKKCEDRFESEFDVNICLRQLEASLRMMRAISDNFAGGMKISYDTPEKNVVSETNMKYPSPQCRLDTYMAGALQLTRPKCWYKE